MDDLLTTAEAAKFLGVSAKTIKRWRKSGHLAPVQTGDNGYSRYSREQLGTFKLKLGTTGNTLSAETRDKPKLGTSETGDMPPKVGNGINLSNAIVKRYRITITTVSSEESIVS